MFVGGFVPQLTMIKMLEYASEINPLNSTQSPGHGWLFGKDPIENFFEFRAKYGDIYRFDTGHVPSVVLTKYEDIVDLFGRDSFAGRGWSLMTHLDNVFDSDRIDGKFKFTDTWLPANKGLLLTLRACYFLSEVRISSAMRMPVSKLK